MSLDISKAMGSGDAERSTDQLVPRMQQGSQHDAAFLDRAYHGLVGGSPEEGRVHGVLDELFSALQTRRLKMPEEPWRQLVSACRTHPLKTVLHEDPFTLRAYRRPRGYAGDAVLLDFIYGREERWPAPMCTPLGQQIFDFTTSAPASQGVRARRGFIADLLDQVAAERRRPEVLSIAAGHLREAALSAAVRRERLGRLVALDADPRSLEVVRDAYGDYGVETVHARFRELLTGQLRLGLFDLVYSTGLFDYLAQPTGQRLVAIMFNMLRANGQLLVANFLPGIRDVGYMEAYMDWRLVYRSRHEMLDLTAEIPQSEIADVRLFAEENQNIIFLAATRG